jgi:hypothetical protein
MGAGQKLAAELFKATNVPALYIGYSDTSDAAMTVRYEPGPNPKRKAAGNPTTTGSSTWPKKKDS